MTDSFTYKDRDLGTFYLGHNNTAKLITTPSHARHKDNKALYTRSIQGNKIWHSQGDSNPCLQTENLSSANHNTLNNKELPNNINLKGNDKGKDTEKQTNNVPDLPLSKTEYNNSIAPAILKITKLNIPDTTKADLIQQLLSKE